MVTLEEGPRDFRTFLLVCVTHSQNTKGSILGTVAPSGPRLLPDPEWEGRTVDRKDETVCCCFGTFEVLLLHLKSLVFFVLSSDTGFGRETAGGEAQEDYSTSTTTGAPVSCPKGVSR